jgi:diguanylate cyclase (GGDEF)-like protein
MVANGIRSAIRAEDAIARIGGDEFVVVLEDVAQREQAEEVGRKILTSLPELPEPDYPGLRINLSLGIAMYPEDGSDADSLIKTADEHMYRNKRRQ